jgi:Tfp pilus assembly protein PilX
MSTRKHLNPRLTRNEDGFAIPIAVGMGLIMILLALTAIAKSQDDRVTSINKKDTARSLLAAESGVTQIQALMNRYRTIASYPACQGNWKTDNTCSDTGTIASWALAANLKNLTPLPPRLNSVCSANDDLSVAETTVQGWANTNWKKVDPDETETDPTKQKGEFRLLDYRGGILTVEGRINGTQSNEALSQLRVTVPQFNPGSQPVAPLWVTGSVSGSPTIGGDVMGSCASTLNTTFPSGKDYKAIQSRLSMPPTVSPPTSGSYSLTNISGVESRNLPQIEMMTDSSTGKRIPKEYPVLDASGNPVLDASGNPIKKTKIMDTPDSDGVYKYIVSSLDASFAVPRAAFSIDASGNPLSNIKVQIWVTGNLDLSDKIIVNQCAGETSCTPFNVTIYGTNGNLTLNPETRICDVLFHMPDYDVVSSTTAAANTTQDCGAGAKNTGIYWVKSWTGSGVGVAIDTPRVKWEQSPVQPPPRIGPIQDWKPQQSS